MTTIFRNFVPRSTRSDIRPPFASRREQLALAVKALSVLLPRDRDLVQWQADGVPLDEQARRLGIGEEAASRASLRARERFRAAFRLLETRG